jgi:hypothetical protein
VEAVVFIGIQGAGKTTFYGERFAATHLRLSLDMLKSRHRLDALMRACLAAGQPFVIDNTNVLASERAPYIAAARAAGFAAIGYFFEVTVREAIARNKQRAGKALIPIPGLVGTFKRLEPPRLDEGFTRLYKVQVRPEREFVVQEVEFTAETQRRREE